MDAGVHTLTWDGRDETGRPLRAGIYVCTATVGAGRLSRTIALVR